MLRMSQRIAWALLCVPVLAVADPTPGRSCHVIKADFTPIADKFEPQIVMWVEDSAGHYIDTIFMTEQTGRFGLGNRPGRYDFNSGPGWPYGRRSNVFPVWSHRHGMTFPQVGFQTQKQALTTTTNSDLAGGRIQRTARPRVGPRS